jgi:hypothetical protein
MSYWKSMRLSSISVIIGAAAFSADSAKHLWASHSSLWYLPAIKAALVISCCYLLYRRIPAENPGLESPLHDKATFAFRAIVGLACASLFIDLVL